MGCGENCESEEMGGVAVDRRRNGDARKEGNASRHTRNCNSFARGVNAGVVREHPRENRKNPKDRTMWHCLGGIAEARGGSLRFC